MATPPLSSLIATLQAALTAPTQAAAQLPDAADLQFERTLSRKLRKDLDNQATQLIGLVQQLLVWTEVGDQAKKSIQGIDAELVSDGVYGDVVARVETLLEHADAEIEKYISPSRGASKAIGDKGADFVAPARVNLSAAERKQKRDDERNNGKPPLARELLYAELPKPQLLFDERLLIPRIPLPLDPTTSLAEADVANEPIWTPVLRKKLHARDSNAEWKLVENVAPPAPRPPPVTPQEISRAERELQYPPPPHRNRSRYAHPYAAELSSLVPPPSYYARPSLPAANSPTSFVDVPFKFVDSAELFDEMMVHIRETGLEKGGKKELAVDLEHHDFRSWGGITSLIQLSTRTRDFVIDVIDPIIRSRVEELNEFFADPEWMKVFHGANSDIIWLQRDFGLYIIGLFDTYHATHILSYPQHSLASLLERFTPFIADKRYQMADWRIRPIPEEMLHYARSDTHFLLDIYDHLRIAIHEQSLLVPIPPPTIEVDPAPIEDFTATTMLLDVAPRPTAAESLLTVFNLSTKVSASLYELPHHSFYTGRGDNGWYSILRKNQQEKSYLTALAVPNLPIKTSWGPGEMKFELLRSIVYWRERMARELDESCRFVLGNIEIMKVVDKVATGTIVDSTALQKVLEDTKYGWGELFTAEGGLERLVGLFEVIQNALKRVTVGPNGLDRPIVEFSGGWASDKNRGEAAEECIVRPAEGIWGTNDNIAIAAPSLISTISGFFGGVGGAEGKENVQKMEIDTPSSSTGVFAKVSSFFGVKTTGTTSTASSKLSAVKKVHDSLVLGGGLANSIRSQAIPAPRPVPVVEEPARIVIPAAAPEAASMDHSYVPLSGRLPRVAPPPIVKAPTPKRSDSDVLVVSSMPDKPKKRRRAKVDEESAEPVASTSAVSRTTTEDPSPPKRSKSTPKKIKTPKVVQEALAPHDYSASPSILDAEPEAKKVFAGGKAQKKKDKAAKMEAFTADTADFRRAPRVNNAPKRGNVSKSFES